MSEHVWVLENIATYRAGGLDPIERGCLEEHIAACRACADALEEAGQLDQSLEAVFADIRPDPALEDRMVQALRIQPVRAIWYKPVSMRALSGVAAIVLLGVLGAGMSDLAGQGSLPFPGGAFLSPNAGATGAANSLKQIGLSLDRKEAESEQVAVAGGGGAPAEPADANHVAFQRRGSAISSLGVAGVGEGSKTGSSPGMQNLSAETLPPTAAAKGEITHSDDRFRPRSGRPLKEQSVQQLYTYRNELPSPKADSSPVAGRPLRREPMVASDNKDIEKGADKPTFGEAQGKGAARVVGQLSDSKSEANNSQEKRKENEPPTPRPGGEPGQPAEAKPAVPQAPITPRKLIRSGEMEFEIESFDSAVATITKLVMAIQGGFVATVNSEKLPNGKVRGSVVVRVPPEGLDTLVLDLRRELGKGGELKGQRIGSQDITKQYTDLESRLRAARAMEERLLQIIKTAKGEIKDLVQAEKELGVWRTKIEEIEGELRYYTNLVSLSTLTLKLYEREIRAPFAVIETERVQMGVEVEDVDRALRQAVDAVTEVKGRVTKSELKQLAAGQYSALLQFEIAPDAAGPIRDRVAQLGNVARLEIDRLQQTEGGTGRPQDAKSKRNDSQFIVALYNLTNVAPRETVQLKLVCGDVETVYKAILARVQKAGGRVVTSNLNHQRTEQTTATINVEVRTAEADAVLQSLKEHGEVMRLQITENPDLQNTTKSKRGINVELWALGQVAPRETSVLQLATRDVPAGYRSLQDAVAKAKGRVLNAQLNEQDKQNISAQLDFEIRRVDEPALDAALAQVGNVFSRNMVRAQDTDNVIDSKVRWQVSLVNAANLKPRETFTLAIEVANVEKTAVDVSELVRKSGGHTVGSQLTHRRDGSVVAKKVFDIPLGAASALIDDLKSVGKLRLQEASQNPEVPDVALAVARLDVTLSNTELIVPSDDGLWPQVRRGLSNSLLAIFWSLSWVIFGLLVVLPWALLIYGAYRLVAWLRKKTGSATTTA